MHNLIWQHTNWQRVSRRGHTLYQRCFLVFPPHSFFQLSIIAYENTVWQQQVGCASDLVGEGNGGKEGRQKVNRHIAAHSNTLQYT